MNGLLIDAGVLDVERGAVVGFVVETGCHYFAPLAFPERHEAGVRVASVGHSSARFEVGIFAVGAESSAAQGHFVHVYVDRSTRRPVPLPERLARFLKELQ